MIKVVIDNQQHHWYNGISQYSSVLQLANDIKMLHIIRDATDYHQLQQDTNNFLLCSWANRWQLNFMTHYLVAVMLFLLVIN